MRFLTTDALSLHQTHAVFRRFCNGLPFPEFVAEGIGIIIFNLVTAVNTGTGGVAFFLTGRRRYYIFSENMVQRIQLLCITVTAAAAGIKNLSQVITGCFFYHLCHIVVTKGSRDIIGVFTSAGGTGISGDSGLFAGRLRGYLCRILMHMDFYGNFFRLLFIAALAGSYLFTGFGFRCFFCYLPFSPIVSQGVHIIVSVFRSADTAGVKGITLVLTGRLYR